jgi:hypothetical protein
VSLVAIEHQDADAAELLVVADTRKTAAIDEASLRPAPGPESPVSSRHIVSQF